MDSRREDRGPFEPSRAEVREGWICLCEMPLAGPWPRNADAVANAQPLNSRANDFGPTNNVVTRNDRETCAT